MTAQPFDTDTYWRDRERNDEYWVWECAECEAQNRNHPTQGCHECDYVGEVGDL